MNSLSWMLYFAGVADRSSHAAEVLSVIFGFAAVCSTIALLVTYCCTRGERPDADCVAVLPTMKLLWKSVVIVFCFVMTLMIFLPNKTTIYAMMASEIGQTAYQSKTGQELSAEAIDAVRGFLKQMAEPKHD